MTEGDIPDTQLAALIERAATKIEDFGWTQCKLWDGDENRYTGGSVCAIGALIIAAGGAEVVDENRREVVLAREAIETILESEYETDELAEWNDETGREAREVVEVFRTTAQSLRPVAEASA